MKNKKVLLIILIVFVLLIAGAYALYSVLGNDLSDERLSDAASQAQNSENDSAGAERAQVPDFTVYDADGNAVKLSDFVGKPVVLNFWASWCGPCQNEMPAFEEKFLEYGEEIQFLMVNMTDGTRETKEVASDFVKEKGYSFPVMYDIDSNAAVVYAVNAIPATYFIDKEGRGTAWVSGAADASVLQRGIDMIYQK